MASSTTNQPDLTADQVQRILVKPLEQASVCLAASPRIFDSPTAGVVRTSELVSIVARVEAVQARTQEGARASTPATDGDNSFGLAVREESNMWTTSAGGSAQRQILVTTGR